MKGLLIKDFKLMKGQKNFFFVIASISIIEIVTMSEASFIIGFVGFVGSLFTLSSISYDEFDNGNAFLFSLPISRKMYVLEKYCFGFITSIAAWALGVLAGMIAAVIKNTGSPHTILLNACRILPFIPLLLSIMLPLHLKFGGEKGRIALISIIASLFGIGVILINSARLLGMNITPVLNRLANLNVQIYAILYTAGLLILLLISCLVSIAVMNHKEF